ncbi:hypothetical protein SY88_10580 [Clostridiales bacterium PH28_bin88]|nr:hypothetical protein SY88_10580 [Clostridiales bacterium PH28_bin88]
MLLAGISFPGLASPQQVVWVIPVEGAIDAGLAKFLERTYQEADQQGVVGILLEVDTPGGYVDSALKIGKTITRSQTPTTVYVTGGAISAGAYIAFSADRLVMAPGTTIGAAEPRLGTQKADEKTVSYWAGQMAAAAEAHGRDPKVAAAMVDADVEIPGLVAGGKLLTLTDKQALDLNMADRVLESRQQVLEDLGLGDARVVEIVPSAAENLARWATSPYVSPLLLTIGFAGLLIEMFTPGFGIPGGLGLVSLALYFGGHIISGLTGWESILLFLLGIILLAVEILVLPGFGVAGIGGLAAMTVSIVMTAPSTQQAITSLVVAIAGTGLLVGLSFKFLPTRRVWHRLVLSIKQERKAGYVAPERSLAGYVGKSGTTITPLRPAGAMELASGERLDVVTDGSFIPRGTPVKVVKVEGARVVVRPEKDSSGT